MSPEQGQGKKVDRRSDVYSLGVVLYEMLTGRVPFEAETPLAVVWKHANEPLPMPRSINPEIPEAMERVVLKALAKSAEDRCQTTGEMAKALNGEIQASKSPGVQPQGAGKPKTKDVAASPQSGRASLSRLRKNFPLVSLGALLVLVGAIVVARVLTPGQGTGPTGVAGQSAANSAATSISPSLATTSRETAAPPPPIPTLDPSQRSTPSGVAAISAGTVLFEEDFEGDQVRGIGFSAEPGWRFAADESGNRVYEMDNREGSGYKGFSFGMDEWEDYSVEFRGRLLGFTGSGSEIGLLFRNDGENHYVLDLGEEALYLAYSIGGGEWTRLVTQFPDIQRDAWYNIRVDVKGEEVAVYLDDTQVINARGSRIRRGWVLIFVGPHTNAQVDDIRVTLLGS
jgi:hypothetical protein